MRLNRFYTERKNIRVGSSVKLNDSDVNHIRKVLRLQKGENIIVFNGEKEFLAELSIVGSEFITVKLLKLTKSEDFSYEHKVEITLFQCLLRAGKFDLIIEKVTELGIDNIIPVEAEFSQTKLEVVARKLDRWNKVAISASKQSERITIPEIHSAIHFKDIKELLNEFDELYLFTIPRDNIEISKKAQNVKELLLKKSLKKVGFLIGPEGGFSPKEHQLANEWGLKFIKLNESILKSETAAIIVTALMEFIYNY